MDEIRIENLSFHANHGVYDFERLRGQRFVVSASLKTDMGKAGRSDYLEDSTNYGEVCAFLVGYLPGHTFSLLEAAAEQVCRALLLQFPLISEISLELKKPDAPIPLEFSSVSVAITRGWHRAFLALGSNLGDTHAALQGALKALAERPEIRLKATSRMIVTRPYGGVEQDDFLNGACEVETLLSPMELLEAIREIEAAFHRTREIHWGPRTLDLDILLYDNIIMYTDDLKIPHPDMENRSFVLDPLEEIAPYAMHPLSGKSVRQLKRELDAR